MKRLTLSIVALIALGNPALAQERPQPEEYPSPNEIVGLAKAQEWVRIAAEDLLVMTLAPDAQGNPREVIIQLMPAPFSQGWVENIRILARADWYAGTAVTRVQDNYVVQWGPLGGDPNAEDAANAKPLPDGLKVMGEEDYAATDLLSIPDPRGRPRINYSLGAMMMRNAKIAHEGTSAASPEFRAAVEKSLKDPDAKIDPSTLPKPIVGDDYADFSSIIMGWPIAGKMGSEEERKNNFWPVHCYGMVGVGRDYSPDTGSGAELYTVIGHAPRHLDRNIALVGRVIEGIKHLSSMTRGSGPLGFYTEEEAELRTPIQSIRVVSDLQASSSEAVGREYASSSGAVGRKHAFEYLSTESESFARYAEARANRRDPFFIKQAGGADICNIPVPVRRVKSASQ